MVATASAVLQEKTASITGRPDWWPDWEGQTIAIIASGPTAKKAGVELLQGKVKVIAINESWQLCPWADALYGCDGNWWSMHHGVQKFKGLKISADHNSCVLFKEIKEIKIANVNSNDLLMDVPGHVGAGGNSGFQVLNLAAQFGPKRILLVGYDMRVDFGEHWHPRHQMPLSNPCPLYNLPRWRAAIDGAADRLGQAGIEVVNCSPVSLLRAYPKMTIAEALRWPHCQE